MRQDQAQKQDIHFFKAQGVRSDGGPLDGGTDQSGAELLCADASDVQASEVNSFFETAPGAYQLTRFRLADGRETRNDLIAYVKKPVGSRFPLLSIAGSLDSLNNPVPHIQAIGAIPCRASLVRQLLPGDPQSCYISYPINASDNKTFTVIGISVDTDWAGDGSNDDTRAQIVINGNRYPGETVDRFARIVSVDVVNNRVTLDSTFLGSLIPTREAWIWPGYQTAHSIVGYRNRFEGIRPVVVGFNGRAIAFVPGDRPLVVRDQYCYPFGLRQSQKSPSLSTSTSGTVYLNAGSYQVFTYISDARNNRLGPKQAAPPDASFSTTLSATGKITVGAGNEAAAGSFPNAADPFRKKSTVTVSKDGNGEYKKITITAGDAIEARDLWREVRLGGAKNAANRLSASSRVRRIETEGATGVFYLEDAVYNSTESGDKTSETLYLWTEEYTHWGIAIREQSWDAARYVASVAKETAEDIDNASAPNYAGYVIGGVVKHTAALLEKNPKIPQTLYPLNGFSCAHVFGRRLALGRRPFRALSSVQVTNAGADYSSNGYPRVITLEDTVDPENELLRVSDEGRTILINGKPYLLAFVISPTVGHLANDFTESLSTIYPASLEGDEKRLYVSNADDDRCEMGDPFAYIGVLYEADDGIRAISSPSSRTLAVHGERFTQRIGIADWADREGEEIPLVQMSRDEDLIGTGAIGNQAVTKSPEGDVYLFRGVRGLEKLSGRSVFRITFDRLDTFLSALRDTKFSEACVGYWEEKNWVIVGNLYSDLNDNPYPEYVIIYDVTRDNLWLSGVAHGCSTGVRQITSFCQMPMRRIPNNDGEGETIVDSTVLYDVNPFVPSRNPGAPASDDHLLVQLVGGTDVPALSESTKCAGQDANGNTWYWGAVPGIVYQASGASELTSVSGAYETVVSDEVDSFIGNGIGTIGGEGVYFIARSNTAGKIYLYFVDSSGATKRGEITIGTVVAVGMATDGDILFSNQTSGLKIYKVNPADFSIRANYPYSAAGGILQNYTEFIYGADGKQYASYRDTAPSPDTYGIYSFTPAAGGITDFALAVNTPGAPRKVVTHRDGTFAIWTWQAVQFYNASWDLLGSVTLNVAGVGPTIRGVVPYTVTGLYIVFAGGDSGDSIPALAYIYDTTGALQYQWTTSIATVTYSYYSLNSGSSFSSDVPDLLGVQNAMLRGV